MNQLVAKRIAIVLRLSRVLVFIEVRRANSALHLFSETKKNTTPANPADAGNI